MKEIEWKSPATIVGPAAEGQSYLRRPELNAKFWREIEKGSHILFVAPRRVGKTSVMKDLASFNHLNIISVYQDVESYDTQQTFYKRLFILILDQMKGIRKLNKVLGTYRKKLGIKGVGIADLHIEFERLDLNYKDQLMILLQDWKKINRKMVFFLDEFPDVINKIRIKEGDESAIETLHFLREIRMNNSQNMVFVFAGSIGLEHVVKDIDRPKLIADLVPIRIPPFTDDEARNLIHQLVKNATMQIGENELNYILLKIRHLIPYFLQLMVDHCNDILLHEDRQILTTEDVDQAYSNILKGNIHLSDWEVRLKKYLTLVSYKFCRDLLTLIAHHEKMSLGEIYNMSKNKAVNYKELTDMLERDGYLIDNDNDGNYRFLSPVLRDWWKRQHPEFEIGNGGKR